MIQTDGLNWRRYLATSRLFCAVSSTLGATLIINYEICRTVSDIWQNGSIRWRCELCTLLNTTKLKCPSIISCRQAEKKQFSNSCPLLWWNTHKMFLKMTISSAKQIPTQLKSSQFNMIERMFVNFFFRYGPKYISTFPIWIVLNSGNHCFW